MTITNIDQLRNALVDMSSPKHKILDVFYYKKGTARSKDGDPTKRDMILVTYVWDCLGVDYQARTFTNVEDCLNHFYNNKTELSEVSSKTTSLHSTKEIVR